MPSAKLPIDGKKQCRLCRQWKPATTEFFYPHPIFKDGLRTECKVCKISDTAQWQKANKPHVNAVHQKRMRERLQTSEGPTLLATFNRNTKKSQAKLRQEVLNAYGNLCSRCGETELRFLTIEHLHGGGLHHRNAVGGSSVAMYRDIKKQGFPPRQFTVYCWNCQWESRVFADTPMTPYRTRVKQEMIAAYGGRCRCCGFSGFQALTLEHVNRDGKNHRASVPGRNSFGTWRDLKKRGWPQEGYAILCASCNAATRYGNPCPHTLKAPTSSGY